VGTRSSCRHWSKHHRQMGRIDIVVCNAAANPHFGLLQPPRRGVRQDHPHQPARHRVVVQHDAAGNGGTQRRSGDYRFSVGGFIGSALLGAYCISKAADMQLARNLAVEWGRTTSASTALRPASSAPISPGRCGDPGRAAAFARANPLRRLGDRTMSPARRCCSLARRRVHHRSDARCRGGGLIGGVSP